MRLGARGGGRTALAVFAKTGVQGEAAPSEDQLDFLAVGRESRVALGALDELVETGDSATVAVA